jgi:hypothetical protein
MFLEVRLVHFARWLKDRRQHGDPSSGFTLQRADAGERAGFATVAVLTFGAGHWREHSDLQSDRCEVKFTQSRHPLASDLMP